MIAESDDSAQLDIEEPPPLEEWLKGREIITVAKDGSGQFDTIQAALNALKPGQVVEVLDSGPYDENLQASKLPDDAGLVSRVQTTIAPRNWIQVNESSTSSYGHVLHCDNSFRLTGVRFIDISRSPPTASAYTVLLRARDTFTIEKCCFVSPKLVDGSRTFPTVLRVEPGRLAVVRNTRIAGCIQVYMANDTGSCVVKESWIGPHTSDPIALVGSHGTTVLQRNVIDAFTTSGIYIGRTEEARGRLVVRGNLIRTEKYVFNLGTYSPQCETYIAENVIVGDVRLQAAAAQFARLAGRPWTFHANWWNQTPSELADELGVNSVVQPVAFLTVNGDERDYLRFSPESPTLADGDHYGPFSPGPASPEGDWFTRLQERWKETQEDLNK